jgi:serine/threonine protein kinase
VVGRSKDDVEVVFLDEDIVYGDDERDVQLGSDYYVGFWSRVLGKGSFATVKLATNRSTGHQVAVKIIKRKTRPSAAASEEELLQREIKHHNLLRHDNIVRLYTWVTTPKEFLLVMEFCTGGDMLRYINECQDLRTSEARYFFAQLLEGVAFCHSLGIGHRDLKLENLMLCESAGAGGGASGGSGAPPAAAPASSVDVAAERPSWEGWTLKITDFGLSDLNPIGVLSTTCCGSPLYAAPELVGIGPLEGFDASKSDMWSCGVILYAFLTSRLPFDGDRKSVV